MNTTVNTKTVTVGQKAPDFTLPLATGDSVTLSQVCEKGPVVVAFFPGAFTTPCTKEVCTFSEGWGEFEKLGAHFIGVTPDSIHAQKAWIARDNIQVPLASDFEKTVLDLYGVGWNAPWGLTNKRCVFVVNKQGVVSYAWVSEDAKAEPNYAEIRECLSGLQ